MSENIQSISQGTFTIGQTSATNFQAGPGIQISQPSEGTVRIANDETVLWSAANIENRTSACTLSESLKNFEHVDIWLAHGTYGPTRAVSLDFNVMGNTGYFNVLRPRGEGNLNAAFMFISATDTTLTCSKSKCVSFGSYTSTSTGISCSVNDSEDRNCLYKVVGINRISGGNE